jgi:AAA family ATP:ADP antiporter
MEQGRIVEHTFADRESRTAAFARLDVYTQSLTLLLQLFLTSRIIRALGVGGTLSIVPILTIAGFAALMMRDSFAVLAVFMVARRASHYALDRPAREVLYTVVGADAKYKSKAFIDTFIYRGGDVIGGWTEQAMTKLTIAVGWLAIPLAAVGFITAFALGRFQHLIATRTPSHAGERESLVQREPLARG